MVFTSIDMLFYRTLHLDMLAGESNDGRLGSQRVRPAPETRSHATRISESCGVEVIATDRTGQSY